MNKEDVVYIHIYTHTHTHTHTHTMERYSAIKTKENKYIAIKGEREKDKLRIGD